MAATGNLHQLVFVSSRVIHWLFTWSWQILIVLSVAWMAIKLDRSKSAAVRYRIWLLSVLVVSILPLLSAITQSFHFEGVATPINWPTARFEDFGGTPPININAPAPSFSWLSMGWIVLLAIWAAGAIFSTLKFCVR
ncbi:MAG TPA: hypothetical protein VFC63_17790 [Blastocatellia bacterium]|nr:hypothetical protein [Blastocatellia bacterium]